jgi:hypothetical protein
MGVKCVPCEFETRFLITLRWVKNGARMREKWKACRILVGKAEKETARKNKT